MKKSTLIRLTLAVSFWSLVAGTTMAIQKIDAEEALRQKPYRVVMQETVENLRQTGIYVAYPKRLPPIMTCSACLGRHGAFGAYIYGVQQIVVPDNFDISSAEGHAILVHEYAHYLLTAAGIPREGQEMYALRLGNISYRPYFIAALED